MFSQDPRVLTASGKIPKKDHIDVVENISILLS